MHEKFLLAALEQAQLGKGRCAPNPSVGAVAVQNGNIIAQACHQGAGTPHAESLLLAQLAPKMPGISVYITLEPCNHWGKTPPCADAIINYGVEQVFFSYLDPNPLVTQSQSVAKLRAHGIKVTHLPMPEIDAFYQSYTHWILTGKPRVTVKMAQSLDGKIGRTEGERLVMSNDLCAQFTHEMRAASDVILTTARTITLDNPQMNVRLNGAVYSKPIAIIDKDLNLNPNSLIFSTARHCLIYHKADMDYQPIYPNSSYHPFPLKDGVMDLELIITDLGRLGYHDVWVEAGGAVFSALHNAGLVNKTYLYLVPISLGPQAVSGYHHNGIFQRPHTITWHSMGDNMLACFDWQEN
jgi:diaminohydroxyphosphoribosylaminopyrimidine deaminase/5-amino-6-(5-phosphoribosylamino)uracil reductase